MAGRLASPRFRRRLAWTVALVGGTAVVVAAAVVIGNTGRSNATKIDESKPAWVYRAPAHLHLTRKDRLQLYLTAAKFVATAVRREHLDSAWPMLAPEMRAGQTRRSWDTGFNNVVPFEADGIQSWTILYSYGGDVALDLSLYHRGSSADNWSGKTFTIELKRSPSTNRWLVASWVPKGIGGGGTLSANRRAGPPPPSVKPSVSAKWLLLPALLLATLLLVLGVWGVHGAVRGRRASRRYAEALGYSESSNPS